MSRKNKTLRAFLHQTESPTVEQVWSAAWTAQQKRIWWLEHQVKSLKSDRTDGFESWAKAAGFMDFETEDGRYADDFLQHAYLGWQAAPIQTSGQWVRCDEKLPKHDGDYLASDGKNVDLCSFYNRHKLFCPQTHDPEYFKKATHWMELPEPPANNVR